MAFAVTPAVYRLDQLCDALHRAGGDEPWPAALREATAGLAEDLEHLAGALDRADTPAAMHEIITAAREILPRNFAELGVAIIDDLIREFRAARAPVAGTPGTPKKRRTSPRRLRLHADVV